MHGALDGERARLDQLSPLVDLVELGQALDAARVDGDELYDPARLENFRRELLGGAYGSAFKVAANVLNCVDLDVDQIDRRVHALVLSCLQADEAK